MKKLTLLTLSILLSSTSAFAQASEVKRYPWMNMVSAGDSLAWKVTKTSWSAGDEVAFGQFVQDIGMAVERKQCRNFESCMTNPDVNKYALKDPVGIRYFADCADVPYWLRTYFAYHNGLPGSITVNTEARDPNDPKKDNRNSTILGNKVLTRADSVAKAGKFPNITQFLSSTSRYGLILDSISSGTLRSPVIPDASEPLADFYPIAINRASLRAGTVVYTADGHVAIVYKVDDDGNIRTLNGHPADQNAAQSPLSVRDYNDTFKRSRQEHGSIFKNFRPLELVGAQRVGENLIGGRIEFKDNSQIPAGFPPASTEQATRKFDSTSSYFMFVRHRMSSGDLKMDVLTEFKRSLKNVCDTVQGRVELVDQAIKAGIDRQTLEIGPDNIFSAHGAWENYSTPSRDVNIRVLFKKTLDDLKTSVKELKAGNPTYVYTQPISQLGNDLKRIYVSTVRSCLVTFTTRAGVETTLTLEKVRQRMFAISFDPYHCPDLRWGEEQGPKNCTEDARWYNSQQYLRNMTEKTSDSHKMTVQQMEAQNKAKNRPVTNWDTDIDAYIDRVRGVTPAPVAIRR